MYPKVTSATIRFTDGRFVSIRPNTDGSYTYRYWSAPNETGGRRIIAKNDRNTGVWAAMIAVAAMVNPSSTPKEDD